MVARVVGVQAVEFPDVEGPLEFGYDKEWLAILQAIYHLMSLNRQQAPLPGKLSWVAVLPILLPQLHSTVYLL